MKKKLKKSTIFTLIVAVVFLNVTFDAHAEELQNKSTLSSGIAHSASTGFQQSLSPEQSSTTEMQNTGDKATVTNSNEQATNQQATNNNTASAEQNVNATANTGNNIAERNIAIGGNAGMISTGNAGILTTAQLNTNGNSTVLASPTTSQNNYSGITNTGNSLSTSNSQDMTHMTAVQNNNKTTVIQNVNANTNTGGNLAPRNISIGGQAGVIQTGTAYTGSNLLLAGNGNVALVGGESNGYGPGSGASVVLFNTGDRLNNSPEYSQQSNTEIENNNDSNVAQSCLYCSVNTGNNTSNRNINTHGDAGVISTGNAILAMTMGVQGNSNTTAIGNQTNNTEVSNINSAHVAQNMNGYANTGDNEASRNIAIGGNAGIIKTGAAYVLTFLSGLVNSNTTQ